MAERRAARRLAVALAAGAVLATAAPWLAPQPPAEQLDPAAGALLPPGSRRITLRLADGRTLLAERATRAAGGWDVVRRGERFTVPAPALAAPPAAHRFALGSDRYGRDVLSRLLAGTRPSLAVGVATALVALALGTGLGGLAAACGGWVDAVVMRGVDALLAVPRLFLLLGLAATTSLSPVGLVAALAATGWMPAARLVRAEVLALRRRDFVAAARAGGAPPLLVLRRHLLPAALAPAIVDATTRVGDVILLEAALSFLGAGIAPPAPSWGGMIADGADVVGTAWWTVLFPGLAVAGAAAACALLGDRLRDDLDPRTAAGPGVPRRRRAPSLVSSERGTDPC